MQLDINFENCFGIKKINTSFIFSNEKRNYVIYASNGTMKSSFAETFLCYAEGRKPADRIFEDRITSCDIKLDGNDLDKTSIFVVNPDKEIDANEKISSFIASRDLKRKYDDIYRLLDLEKRNFITTLKGKTQSSDCESEIIDTFREHANDDLFSCLKRIHPLLKQNYELYDFKYNDVFDKKGSVKSFVEKNGSLIKAYMERYVELLESSGFFHKGSGEHQSFGIYQAETFSKSLADGAFFRAEHKIILKDGASVESHKRLKEIIDDELDKINKDEKLKKSFEKIQKEINKNVELRAFENVIEQNQSIVPLILDYEGFKKQVWYGYLKSMSNFVDNLVEKYDEKIIELQQIISDAKKENEQWKNIIKIYNSRFHVPFKVELENQEDVILKDKVAALIFKYQDGGNEKKCDKEKIKSVLSKGEKRAFFMLQFIFEIESRKAQGKQTFLICDDIADSFDYKNKYAIIEYLKDVQNDFSNLFYTIILTHNFDFYRTIASRLGISRENLWTATKCESGIKINKEGKYIKDAFAANFGGTIDSQSIFITLIPFTRNIIEYTKGNKSEEYKKLTMCLHKKIDSDLILVSDIFSIMQQTIHKLHGQSINYGTKKVHDLIFEEAERISNIRDINETALENKFTLSIAIRLMAEKYMIDKLGANANLADIKKDQMRVLYNKYRAQFNDSSVFILDKVNLMTPENIHVNAFMFEPLIDMSVYHLINLYNEVKALN